MQNASNHDYVQSCLAALDAFVCQAHATVELFREMQNAPFSLVQRANILQQRRVENDAFDQYHIARLALFKIAAEG